MRIGLDLDGTVYAHPQFFAAMIEAMAKDGHQFFCTSSHARSEWPKDCERLRERGINPDLISPEMMYDTRHGHVHLKGQQADRLDVIFDDDFRVQSHTNTVQMCPLKGGNAKVSGSVVVYE